MSTIEFERLVARCELLARRSPRAYRFRLLALALLGYAYLGLMIIVLGGLAAAVFWAVASRGSGVAAMHLALPLAGASLIVLRSLRVRLAPPDGIEVLPKSQPLLFEELEHIRRELRAPRIHRVILDADLNASIVQFPRFGLFGQRNYLVLGFALMATLTHEEFRAVVAHELGHMAGGHGRFSVWVYRVRVRWMQLLHTLDAQSHWSAVLYRWFFRWYAPYFQAYSFVLARQHEYQADRAALRFAGRESLADGLARTAVTGRFLNARFWPAFSRLPAEREEPPADYLKLFLRSVQRALDDASAESWLEQALKSGTHVADTHPSLTDRLRAAGVPWEDPAKWHERLKSRDVTRVAARMLESADVYLAQLSSKWLEENSVAWSQRHEQLQEVRAELESLEAKARSTVLSPGEASRRIELLIELKGPQHARDAARELVEQHPAADTHFLLAGILAELEDPEGLEHIEEAMQQDPALVAAGLAIGHSLLRRLGRDDDALEFELRWADDAFESNEGAWKTPIPDVERGRLAMLREQSLKEQDVTSELRFRAGSRLLWLRALLLVVAAAGAAVVAWMWRNPDVFDPKVQLVAGVSAIASLLLLLAVRRKTTVSIGVLADHIAVTSRGHTRTLAWQNVQHWELFGHSLILHGPDGMLRVPAPRGEFHTLLDAVIRRVVAARRHRARKVGTPLVQRGRERTTTQVATFRRGARAFVPLLAFQALLVAGVYFRIPVLFLIGLGGVLLWGWRISRIPMVVTVGIRHIHVHSLTRTDSILTAAIADLDIAVIHGHFVVLIRNRLGDFLALPDVNSDVLGLYDAIATNFEAAQKTSAQALRNTLVMEQPTWGLQRVFKPLAFVMLLAMLYLPIRSGLALSELARYGDPRVADVLLTLGAPIDGRGEDGRTALYQAARFGHLDLARMLVERGADPAFGSGPTGFAPLHVATENGHTEVVRFLLDLGVDPNVSNANGRTPLFQAAGTPRDESAAIARLLLERGADPAHRDSTGRTPLHRAIEADNGGVVEALADAGADLEATGVDGSRPLHTAVLQDDTAMIALLLRLGARIDNSRPGDGRTALALAARRLKPAALRMLLARGADPNRPDVEGNRPVHTLIWFGADIASVTALLEHGANPNATGVDGATPLALAAARNRPDIVQALLRAGAIPRTTRTVARRTPAPMID